MTSGVVPRFWFVSKWADGRWMRTDRIQKWAKKTEGFARSKTTDVNSTENAQHFEFWAVSDRVSGGNLWFSAVVPSGSQIPNVRFSQGRSCWWSLQVSVVERQVFGENEWGERRRGGSWGPFCRAEVAQILWHRRTRVTREGGKFETVRQLPGG